jgi:hypothetical protein
LDDVSECDKGEFFFVHDKVFGNCGMEFYEVQVFWLSLWVLFYVIYFMIIQKT